MPYSANANLEDLFEVEPVRAAARRMAEGGRDLLHDRAVQRTPVATPEPGHSPEQFLEGRGFRPPGKMRASWKTEPVAEFKNASGDDRFGATVHNTDPQAPHVEWPTRPHIIRPRLDRMMADGSSNASNAHTREPRGLRQHGTARLKVPMAGGGFAFPKEVHHPGTQGVHMMRNAIADVSAQWVPVVGDDELKRWVREQKGGIR